MADKKVEKGMMQLLGNCLETANKGLEIFEKHGIDVHNVNVNVMDKVDAMDEKEAEAMKEKLSEVKEKLIEVLNEAQENIKKDFVIIGMDSLNAIKDSKMDADKIIDMIGPEISDETKKALAKDLNALRDGSLGDMKKTFEDMGLSALGRIFAQEKK